jgi:hypothetical protein
MGITELFKKIFGGKSDSHLKCNLCNKTFPTETEFENHMKTVHK